MPACKKRKERKFRGGWERGGCESEFLPLKHRSRILGHSSNRVSRFSMMELVRLCAVLPMENWLGSSLNKIRGRTFVRESYSRALEQGPLLRMRATCEGWEESHRHFWRQLLPTAFPFIPPRPGHGWGKVRFLWRPQNMRRPL